MYELICAICARIYFHNMYYVIDKFVNLNLFIMKFLKISMWCQIL